MVLRCFVLHCIVLHCIALYCIAFYCIAFYCIALYCIALHCIALYCIVLHCITLYCVVSYGSRLDHSCRITLFFVTKPVICGLMKPGVDANVLVRPIKTPAYRGAISR